MKNRLLISIPVISIITYVLFYLPQWTYIIASLILLRTLWEFYHLYQQKVSCFYKSSLLFSIFYLYFTNTNPNLSEPLLILGIIGLFILQTFDKQNEKGMAKISLTLMGFIYVTYLGSYFFRLYHLKPEETHWGASILFISLFICKFSDAAAYVGGTKFGKHKLIPRISPKKSWEGLGFGYLGAMCAIPMLILFNDFSLKHAFLFCILVSSASVLGDLAESMFKRELNIKDAANDIPGFGGTLDMADSILTSLPMAYFYIKFSGIS